MKIHRDIWYWALVSQVIASSVVLAQTQEPTIPIGKLHIGAEIVMVDDYPVLTWETTHPQTIHSVIAIGGSTGSGEGAGDSGSAGSADDEIVTKRKLLVKVSMIGTGITDSGGNEYDSVSEICFNHGEWEHVFTGPGAAVDVTEVLVERVVEAGTSIEFRSRYAGYKQWRYNDSPEVQIFVDGDEPPKNPSSDALATSAEEYMLPYTENGRLVLGALDLIYAAELTHTDTSSHGYDMQDAIVLVRFTDLETGVGSARGEVDEHINGGTSNNGHGNNLDGVDSSNPGNSGGEDTDSSVDDEVVRSNREYERDLEVGEHDYSDYDTSYGCGNAGGGKPKDRTKRKRWSHGWDD
ncbi:hypothetical protein [Rubritalea marina]|uniref:hypothetical protein n=1 Tax=Rubritalea marina TaxID=361055 RepID=UPI00036853CE|nr:hypothetical protein [Rubritalea marina]